MNDKPKPLMYDKDLIDTAKLSGISLTCAKPKGYLWLRYRLCRIDWWIDKKIWLRLADATHRYGEAPNYNRFLAGVREFAWIKYCGHGWKFATHVGLICWGWAKTRQGPPPQEL